MLREDILEVRTVGYGVRLVPAWGCLGHAEQAVLTSRQQKEESPAYTGLARSSLGPLSPLLCASHSPQVISFSLLAATTIYLPVTPELTFVGLVPSWGPTCTILVGALDQLNQEREQLNSPLPSIPTLCLLLCSKNHNPSVPKTGHQGVILRPSLLYTSGPTDSITLTFVPTSTAYARAFDGRVLPSWGYFGSYMGNS